MRTYSAKELSAPTNIALLEEVILVLTLAFEDDASHKWLLGKGTHDDFLAVLPSYMRFIVSLALSCDATTRVVFRNGHIIEGSTEHSTDLVAAALTIPPHGNATFDSFFNSLRAGGAALPFKCGFGLTWRLITTWLPMLDNMHRKMFPVPAKKYQNWYLFYIGVHPGCQGQGIGRTLIEDIQGEVRNYSASEAQKAGIPETYNDTVPLYLEASTLDGKRLYNRTGFEDICTGTYGTLGEGEDINMMDDGLVLGGRLYGMIWQPAHEFTRIA